MRRIENNYLCFMETDNIACRCSISDYIEGAGLVEFILNKDEGIPMVLNEGGFFWVTEQDEYGNNLYERFPYKVEKLVHSVEYVNED